MMFWRRRNGVFPLTLDWHVVFILTLSKPSNQGGLIKYTKQLPLHSPERVHHCPLSTNGEIVRKLCVFLLLVS